MDLTRMLNDEPGPVPGRNASLSRERSRLDRTPSIANILSPSPSEVTQTSPSHALRHTHENGADRIAIQSMAKPSPPLQPSPASSTKQRPNSEMPSPAQSFSSTGQKRPAPQEGVTSAPAKRLKQRKYTEPPIWARLHPRNPKASGAPSRPAARAAPNGTKATNGFPDAHTSAKVPGASEIHWQKPWLNPLPLDLDLIKAREIFGAWEKSMKYSTPYPDLLMRISDWIVETLQRYRSVTQARLPASFEIEAKIGTLVNSSSGQPVKLPVENMTLLSPAVQRDYRFESELQMNDFRVLNEMLNKTLVESRQAGREAIHHERRPERDSFVDLSSEGLESLPDALRSIQTHGKELKLRTTHDEKTGKVIARIVKVPLSHRQIHNPYGYDCRISINVEVDFIKADLRPLVNEPTIDKPAPPDRKKDRISYRHLETYSVDLTTVHVSTLPPKYELEVEVDGKRLLDQMDLMLGGQSQHAFSDVVSGFLDNAQYLMRQKSP